MNAYSKLTLIVGLIAGSTSAKLCRRNKGGKGETECEKDKLCEWTASGDCMLKSGLLTEPNLEQNPKKGASLI